MLFSREKDDDDDFIPNPNFNSNLASLFSGGGSGANPTLTYTAPKQPKRQSKTASNATPSSATNNSVIIAKTVQTFKMVEGSYQTQGRLGAALVNINSGEGPVYQLLLYRDKKNQLCFAKVTREFNFHIQPKNYCTFYDKQNVIWSILFESTLELVDFALQVALARWKAGEPTTPLMVQDLWCPIADSQPCVAAVGDSVELTYTLHTLNTASQGVEESLNVWVEVEKSGWKAALIGLQPTAKRVVILQPFMLGDLNPKEVVYNCPIVVKMTVVQVSKAVREEPPEPPKEYIPPPKPTKPVVTEPDSVKASPPPSKADLISRMARMGQALPFKTAGPTPSDSDETEEDVRVQAAVPKPRSRIQHSPPAQTVVGMAAPPSLTSPVALTTHQLSAAPYMVSNIYPSPQLDGQAQFQMFFSEVRTTNSELRMGITRLTDKVEALQSKIDESAKSQPNRDLTSAIERLLDNEQQMRSQLQLLLSGLHNVQPSNDSRSPPPSAPSSSVACQRCAELDCSNSALNETISKLEVENEYLRTSTSAQKEALQNAKIADQDQMAQLVDLQKQLEEERGRVSELNERLHCLQLEKESFTTNLEAANNMISNLQNIVGEKQTTIDKLEQALRDSEATKLDEVRRSLQEVLDPRPVIADHVKKILNAVYRLVKVQFEPKSLYEAPFIQSVLADTIKAVTIEYLKNGDLLSTEQAQSSGPHTAGPSGEGSTSGATKDQTDEDTCDSVGGHYVSRDQRSPTAEGRLSSVNPSESNNFEGKPSVVNHNDTSNVSKSQSEPFSMTAPSADESSDDVLRPQPPPFPLFGEEDNQDDWLN